jgi:hypothetical protein
MPSNEDVAYLSSIAGMKACACQIVVMPNCFSFL